MKIRRDYPVPKDRYVPVPNEWARDGRLSRRARSVLVEMMSFAPTWSTSVEALAKNSPEGLDGRDAIQSAIRELREAGYLELVQERGPRGRMTEALYSVRWPVQPPTAAPGAVAPGAVQPGMAEPRAKKNKLQKTETPGKNNSQNVTPDALRAPGTRDRGFYLACLLWMLEEVGAGLVDDPDYEQLGYIRLSDDEVEERIAEARPRLHAARAGQGDRLGEKYPELDARIRGGVWPTRAGVRS